MHDSMDRSMVDGLQSVEKAPPTSSSKKIKFHFFRVNFNKRFLFYFYLLTEKRKEAPDSSESKMGDGRLSSLGATSANTPTSSSHGGGGGKGSKRSRR